MATKIFKHRWQKILTIVVLVIFVLIIIPALLISHFATPILANKIKSAVLKGSDSLYSVNFSDIEINLLRGNVVMYNAALTMDTVVYQQKKKLGLAPNNQYNVQVKRLVLSNVHPFEFYFKKKVDIGRITLNEPELQISYHLNQDKDTIPKDNRTLYQKISKSIKLIHVSQILLTNVNLKYKDYSEGKSVLSELKKLNLTATDLLIDSVTQTDNSRLLYCSDIVTELYNYNSKSADGTYSYKVKSVKYSTHTAQVNIQGLYLEPLLPTAAFFKKTKGNKFTVQLASIQLNNFDFNSYHQYHSISSSKITISKGLFSILSNYTVPPQKTDRIITFPQYGILKKIKAGLNIDTLVLKDIDVSYKQYNVKTGKTGGIVFNNTTGRLLNISNNKEKLKKNNICKTALITYFMGKGKLNLQFIFNLTNPNYNYSYIGHLGPMDMAAANRATMGIASVEIASGRLNSLDFNIHSTKTVSTGKVTMLYNDLKVDLLKTNVGEGYKKKGILSFLANTFILKHNNPDNAGKAPRTANVVYIRPITSPFFKTVWLTLLSGIKPCAGVGSVDQTHKKK